ncbi:hypothetical protein ACC771_11480, partial [Rhizobium ruizarguesonis]
IGPAFAPSMLATFAIVCPPQSDDHARDLLSSKHTPGRDTPDESVPETTDQKERCFGIMTLV